MRLAEFFAKPETWTKRCLARNAAGEKTDVFVQDACCFCLQGGLFRCTDSILEHERLEGKLKEAIREVTSLHMELHEFNDAPETTHAMILEVCRRAER